MKIKKLLERAIELVGSEAKLARLAGYSQNALWQARERGTITPYVARGVHWATRGAISGSDLCPDIWTHPDHVPPPPLEVQKRLAHVV